MVYECPQCKSPLPPGVMACAKCGLQFATPIPADATMPAAGALPSLNASITSGFSLPASDSASSSRVTAIVAALGVVLVAAALFAIYTFTRTPAADTPPAYATASAAPAPPASSLPAGAYTRGGGGAPSAPAAGGTAPVVLSGGSSSPGSSAGASAGSDAALQGRWQAKNMDFYAFNSDGTGSRGNTTNPAKTDNFTWVVTSNQLVLNGKNEERMTFSTGPDASILYLRLPDGHYAKFSKISSS